MTNEQAIEILKQFKRCLSDVVFDEKGSEAWQMAIQALSQEPCDKCAMKNSDSNYCKNCMVAEYHGKKVSVPTKFVEQEPCDDTVSIRKDVLKCRVGKLVVYNVEWLKKHWQMEMDIVCGVKPCEDAVNRDNGLYSRDCLRNC